MLAIAAILPLLLINPAPTPPRYEILDNGLNAVVIEDRAIPAVSVQLWFSAGQADDPPAFPGLCALTLNALTLHNDQAAPTDYACETRVLADACYCAWTAPPSALPRLLDLSAALLQPVDTTRADLDRAARAAARDYFNRQTASDEPIRRLIHAALFPDGPYSRPPGFIAESTAAFPPEEIQAFAKNRFTPAAASLIVIGDVSNVAALQMIRERFASLQSPPPSQPPTAASPPAERIRLCSQHLPPTSIVFAWRTPPLGHFENAALDVLMHRLCNPVDGEFFHRLQELDAAPRSWNRQAWRHAGLLTLVIEAQHDNPAQRDRLEAVLIDEIRRAAESLPDEIELLRARAQAERRLLDNRRHFHRRAVQTAEYYAVAADLRLADYALPRIAAVGVRDLQKAARALVESRSLIITSADAEHPPADSTLPAPLKAPSTHPTPPDYAFEIVESSESEIAPDLILQTNRAPRRGLVEVQTILPKTAPAQPAELRINSLSAAQLRDYLSFHALDLEWRCAPQSDDADPSKLLASTGPAESIPRMIEIHAAVLLRLSPDIRPARIVVTGDVDPLIVQAAARKIWRK